jgi:hypothetical protein
LNIMRVFLIRKFCFQPTWILSGDNVGCQGVMREATFDPIGVDALSANHL